MDTASSADARLDAINSWTKSTEGKIKIYTNPQGWTIGKGPGDSGWIVLTPNGTSPDSSGRPEAYRSVLAAQLRVSDYMGI